MKNIFYIITAVILTASLVSCDELGDLLIVQFPDVAVEEILDVEVIGEKLKSTSIEGTTSHFEHTVTFFDLDKAETDTASTGASLEDYLGSINEINVKKLEFTVLGIYNSLDINFTVDSLSVEITQGTTALYTEVFYNITPDVAVAATNLVPEVVSSISDAFVRGDEVTISVVGDITSEDDIENFNLKIEAIANIVAGLMN
jgi:hypothetical protein